MNEEPDVPPARWTARLRRSGRELLLSAVVFLAASATLGWLRSPALEQAPALSLPVVQGGLIDIDELRGGPIVVNFWATWCGPCRVELPMLSAYAAANPHVPVIGVAIDDPAAVRRVVKQDGIAFPVVVADRSTAAAWGVTSFPTTFVLDARGRVVTSHTGLIVRPWLDVLVAWAGW